MTLVELLMAPLDTKSLSGVIHFATPVFVLLILAEMLAIRNRFARGDYETRDAFASVATGFGSTITGALFAFIAYGLATWLYSFRIATIPTTIATLLLVYIADDFVYYWSHRASHRIRWFWANHIVHHSSQHFNLTTALRQSWFSGLTGVFLFKMPLVLIGFDPLAVVFVGGLNAVYQFWIHTQAIDRLPRWFEAVFNTPSHHRVHHATNPTYLDRNYAGTLIIWDKIFGTFEPENPSEPIRYGIVRNIGTFNPLRIATHEFVSIFADQAQGGLTLGQRIKYLFSPPGWSHDGSRMTSDDIKARTCGLRQREEAAARNGDELRQQA